MFIPLAPSLWYYGRLPIVPTLFLPYPFHASENDGTTNSLWSSQRLVPLPQPCVNAVPVLFRNKGSRLLFFSVHSTGGIPGPCGSFPYAYILMHSGSRCSLHTGNNPAWFHNQRLLHIFGFPHMHQTFLISADIAVWFWQIGQILCQIRVLPVFLLPVKFVVFYITPYILFF